MTLNWGPDTNEVDGTIIYDNKIWSFDALWEAADQGALVGDGAIVPFVEILGIQVQRLEDGSMVVYLAALERTFDEKNYGFIYGICLYAYTQANGSDYDELYITLEDEDQWEYIETESGGYYAFTFTAAQIAAWLETYPKAEIRGQGIDVYYAYSLNGSELALAFLGTYWQGYIPEYTPAP